MGTPLWIVFEVVRYMFGKENVSGIAAIHHPLRDVDSSAGNVRLLVEISDFINGSAMNAHPDFQFRMTLKRLADFQSAEHRRLGAVAKDQSATIARREAEQFAFCFGLFELLGAANNLSKRLQLVALLRDQQLRVANDIDEENVTDLKLHVGERLGW